MGAFAESEVVRRDMKNECITRMAQSDRLTGVLLVLAVCLSIMTVKSSAQPQTSRVTAQKLPANAKVHEMTEDEIRKYDTEAAPKTKGKAGPVVRKPSSGLNGINPSWFAILEQQQTFVAS